MTALDVAPAAADVVVVGAGLAAVRLADTLRLHGFDGSVALLGRETDAPYDRPPLSKQLLRGDWHDDRVLLREAQLFDADGTPTRIVHAAGCEVVSIDAAARTVAFRRSGAPETIRAGAIVLAPGVRAREWPGGTPAGVHVLRTLADARALRAAIADATARAGRAGRGPRVLVVGAGFIGAEAASSAHHLGCTVTVLESEDAPLVRQLGAAMGAACGAVHARHGVTLRTGVRVARVDAGGAVLSDGERIDADVVLVGIGAVPDVAFLAGSAITADARQGIAADDRLRVGPGVYAAGDAVSWPDARTGSRVRLEHWTNAAETAAHAAAALLFDLGLGDDPGPFDPIPYFWSDQYDVKIQCLGRADGHEEVRVVEGSPDDGRWVALYRRGDELCAVLGVQRMRHVMGYRPLLAARATWAAALEHAGVA